MDLTSTHLQTTIGRTNLRLVTGDIADQDTDAVVTAAHWRLNKGTGTDGTIHTKGGPAIYEECRRIGGCPIGDAVITTGGNLKARHVIHAVGPVWRTGEEDEEGLLASAYRQRACRWLWSTDYTASPSHPSQPELHGGKLVSEVEL
jgi:O-acetyl-ADP-ribose deacetylase (regulator of RNase III)